MQTIPKTRVLEKLDELLSKNDYASAKNHLTYWLSEAEAVKDMGSVLLFLNELMGLSRKFGEKENAYCYAQRALYKVTEMGIENNVGAATTYLNCATVFKAFSDSEKALPLYEKAKEIYEKNLNAADTRLAGLYNNMALALVDLKRFGEATDLYEKALTVLEKSKGNEPEMAITFLNMASGVEAEQGLEDGAEKINELCEKAMKMLNSSEDRSSGNYAFVCEKCASVFGYYGYFYYENELKQRCDRIYERN